MWEASLEILRSVIHPEMPKEALVISIVFAAVYCATVRLSGGTFGLNLSSWPRIVVICVIGLALALLAAAVMRVYAAPHVGSPAMKVVLQAGAALVVLLAVVVPLGCLLLKGNYIESLLTFTASFIAAVLISVAVRACWHAVSQGGGSMKKIGDRRENIMREYSK